MLSGKTVVTFCCVLTCCDIIFVVQLRRLYCRAVLILCMCLFLSRLDVDAIHHETQSRIGTKSDLNRQKGLLSSTVMVPPGNDVEARYACTVRLPRVHTSSYICCCRHLPRGLF